MKADRFVHFSQEVPLHFEKKLDFDGCVEVLKERQNQALGLVWEVD